MIKTFKSIMIGGSLLAAVTTTASAEVEFEIYAGYHSIYEFRGVDFGDDMIDGGFELSTEFGSGISFTAGAWYQDSDGNNGNAPFDELDLYVEFGKSIGPVDVAVGYISYIFPGADSTNTDEIYIGVSHELECGLGLGLTYYHDTNEFDAGYLEFEVSKSIEINPCTSLDLSAGAAWSFGYNSSEDGSDNGDLKGFNHFFASVALPWAFSESATLTPYIKYIGADSNFANSEDGDSEDLFYGGISLSFTF